MSPEGTLTVTFNPKLKLPSYTKTLGDRRLLQQEDAQSSKALIDFLNSEYGQLHDYADYACEDGSGEDCAQVSVDQSTLSECDPGDEECLEKYCAAGDTECI